ncbi:MAG TPA: MoxR family ATPase, partial [Aggregatilineales bacterium]|nr:MoxR family ATPase [Aggregatilineales bacterium]
EAQLDRFLLKIQLGYASPAEELTMLTAQQYAHPINNMNQVVTLQELLAAQAAVKEVYVAEEIMRYIVGIVTATRTHEHVYLGSSPRGSLALFKASQVRAAMAGREYVIPDDVKALAEVTLAHRIIAKPEARFTQATSRTIVNDVLLRIPVPGASPY